MFVRILEAWHPRTDDAPMPTAPARSGGWGAFDPRRGAAEAKTTLAPAETVIQHGAVDEPVGAGESCGEIRHAAAGEPPGSTKLVSGSSRSVNVSMVFSSQETCSGVTLNDLSSPSAAGTHKSAPTSKRSFWIVARFAAISSPVAARAAPIVALSSSTDP